jgi:hypothetical protein
MGKKVRIVASLTSHARDMQRLSVLAIQLKQWASAAGAM